MALTIRELARLAGVSTATVSLVLSDKAEGRVSPRRQKAIQALAKKHGYRLNVAARGLSEGRTYRIGVCIQGDLPRQAIIGNFSTFERLGLLAESIRDAEYSMTLVQIGAEQPQEEICRHLAMEPVDGFVFLTWPSPLAAKVLFSLKEKQVPAVAVGTSIDDEALTWVEVDRYAGLASATHRLLQQGHRRIAFLEIDPGMFGDIKRQAFLDAVREETGLDARPWLFTASSPSFEDALTVTDQAALSPEQFDAFILTDNFYGEAVLHGLGTHGITPGGDCRVVGFGETNLANRCVPKLSHYNLRIADQVAFGMKALLDQINSPSEYRARSELLVPQYVHAET